MTIEQGEKPTGHHWEEAKNSGTRKEYLLDTPMPDWKRRIFQQEVEKKLAQITEKENWRRITPKDAARERAYWDRPPFFNPYIQQIPDTDKYVLGVETNFQNSLFVDKATPFDSIESAKSAAEALPQYYMNLDEPNNSVPQYSLEEGWHLTEKT